MEKQNNKLIYTLLTVLLAVMSWVWVTTVSQLSEISKELVAIKTQLVSVQAQMIDEDRVREIVEYMMLKKGAGQ